MKPLLGIAVAGGVSVAAASALCRLRWEVLATRDGLCEPALACTGTAISARTWLVDRPGSVCER